MLTRTEFGRQRALEVEEEEEVEQTVERHHSQAGAKRIRVATGRLDRDAPFGVLILGQNVGPECEGGGQQ